MTAPKLSLADVRLATEADIPAVRALMDAAIAGLLPAFLPPDAVAASYAVMGLDTQLIADRTYFLIEIGGVAAACGGWSHRATLFGGDHSAGRDAALLDPATEPARVRAMYTHPDFTRRGLGRLILAACEDAARTAGFRRAQMAATMAGVPLYEACGYRADEPFASVVGEVAVPLLRMSKAL
ncbi:GNAT family N-acetyltransferase [Phenylobacterium immobile]|uniref:GNAT family N-acetyltransferase n=1 Tax=Phenylobacterium immobile TaxID=21 RepID=UPI000B88B352|nr:GNAT family N-acetyltransferase [Phenylobacterium immobile]